VALGYEEQRLELKKGLTVIHLQPKEGGISADSYDDLSEIKSTWYGIYYHYQNNMTDASKSAQDEDRIMEAVIKYDKEIKSSSRDDREADKGGDFKSSREITGGADKRSKGTGRMDNLMVEENAVAASTVTSKTIEGRPNASVIQTLQGQVPGLNISTGSGQPGSGTTVILRGLGSITDNSNKPLVILDGVPVSDTNLSLLQSDIYDITVLKDADAMALYGNRGASGVIVITTKKAQEAAAHLDIPLRKNLNETAFFYPHLQTNKDGEVIIDFTAPEALTKWKFRGLAHNKSTDYIY